MVNRSSRAASPLHRTAMNPMLSARLVDCGAEGARKMPVQRKVFRIEETTRGQRDRRHARWRHFAGRSPGDHGRAEGAARPRRAPRPEIERATIETARRRASCAGSSPRPTRSMSRSTAPSRKSRRCTSTRSGRRPRASPASSTPSWKARNARRSRSCGAAEEIEDAANTLSASLKSEQEQVARARHPGQRAAHLRGLQFPGPHRPAHRQGADDAEIRRGAHRAHDRDLGRHRAFKPYAAAAAAEHDRNAMLHGPKLDGDDGHVIAGRRRRACSPTG